MLSDTNARTAFQRFATKARVDVSQLRAVTSIDRATMRSHM